MKPDIILVSHKSEHMTRAYNFLSNSKINVLHIENIHDAKAGLALHSPAFLLLDFDINGTVSLLSEITYGNSDPLPYIMVAAAFSNSTERAAMFRQGADACIEKPIDGEEVLAIIGAALRRRQRGEIPHSPICLPYIKYRELTIDFSCREVTMRGKQVPLTRKEFDVLCTLANHAGKVLTKEEIYTTVWKTKYDPKSTHVSDQISSLRHKLGLSSRDAEYIQTVVGVGYRFGTSL